MEILNNSLHFYLLFMKITFYSCFRFPLYDDLNVLCLEVISPLLSPLWSKVPQRISIHHSCLWLNHSGFYGFNYSFCWLKPFSVMILENHTHLHGIEPFLRINRSHWCLLWHFSWSFIHSESFISYEDDSIHLFALHLLGSCCFQVVEAYCQCQFLSRISIASLVCTEHFYSLSWMSFIQLFLPHYLYGVHNLR